MGGRIEVIARTTTSVYLETIIFSYLVARPSRDALSLAHQVATHEWWDSHRLKYSLVTSPLVRREASAGDPDRATKRLALVDQVTIIEPAPIALTIADHLISKGILHDGALLDALHISIAAVHGIQVLLTWNCTHIANANIQASLGRATRAFGFDLPYICTPLALISDSAEDDHVP